MKTKAPKSHSSSSHSHSSKPFFTKSGEGSFFSNSKETEQPFFNPSIVQTKLTIGQPDDKYEQEADQEADQVVQRLKESSVQAKIEPNTTTEGIPQSSIEPKPVVHRVPLTTSSIQRKCSKCGDEMEEHEHDESLGQEKTIQRRPIFESTDPPEERNSIQQKCARCEARETLQTKPEEESSTPIPDLESGLNTSKGSGSQLPDETKSQMEGAFGADFSGVRVHTNSTAVQMNQELGAQAFTYGSDIYFNSGKYDTGSSQGQHLLAHELTHVVQQRTRSASKIIQRLVFQEGGIEFDSLQSCPPRVRVLGSGFSDQDIADALYGDRNVAIVRPDENDPEIIQVSLEQLNQDWSENFPYCEDRTLEGSQLENTWVLIDSFGNLHRNILLDEEALPNLSRTNMRLGEQILSITDSLTLEDTTFSALLELLPLIQRYQRNLPDPIISLYPDLSESLSRSIQLVLRRIPNLREALEHESRRISLVAEEERRAREAALWRRVYEPRGPDSRIQLGERAGGRRVVGLRVIRRGDQEYATVYSINEGTLETISDTETSWYVYRSTQQVVRSMAWLTSAGEHPIMQFLAGFVEGAGEGVLDAFSSIVQIDQTVRAIRQALGNIPEFADQIWQSIIQWKDRFVSGDTAVRARMIGRILGQLVLEIIATRGASFALQPIRRAVSALRLTERLHLDGAITRVRQATERLREIPERRRRPRRLPDALRQCRVGSFNCPIDFLRSRPEFQVLFRERLDFQDYIGELPDIDLNLGPSPRSIARVRIETGDDMYRQFLENVLQDQWTGPFRDAMDRILRRSAREGTDYRVILVGDEPHRWPLQGRSPWTVHHEPPLEFIGIEDSALWRPIPLSVHADVGSWWTRLRRQVLERVPREMRREVVRGEDIEFDIREFE